MSDSYSPIPQPVVKEEAVSFSESNEPAAGDETSASCSSSFFKNIAKDMQEAENSFTTMMLIRKEIEKAFKDLLNLE